MHACTPASGLSGNNYLPATPACLPPACPSVPLAISTLKNLLATQKLRRGDGDLTIPDSRRKERLFGAKGPGRTYALSTGVKCEKLDDDYEPSQDSCIKAFVRMLAVSATAAAAAEPEDPWEPPRLWELE